MRRLVEYLCRRALLRAILVGGSRQLLSRPGHGAVLAKAGIMGRRREMDHGEWRQRRSMMAPQPRRQSMGHSFNGIAVDHITMTESREKSCARRCFSCGGISRLRGPGPFLASQVFLSETLLNRFAFPVVIPNTSSVHDHSATKLTKH